MLVELTSPVQRALAVFGSVALILAVVTATALCLATFLLVRMNFEFFRFRGPHNLLCPDAGNFAIVRIDALHAAVSSLLGEPDLRVRDCSRWPEHQGCRQECLQLAALSKVLADAERES
jgi:hypothetical protein